MVIYKVTNKLNGKMYIGQIYESQKEAAAKLGVSRQTINKWTKEGRLRKLSK